MLMGVRVIDDEIDGHKVKFFSIYHSVSLAEHAHCWAGGTLKSIHVS